MVSSDGYVCSMVKQSPHDLETSMFRRHTEGSFVVLGSYIHICFVLEEELNNFEIK